MIYKEVNGVKSVYFAEILDLTGLWKHNIIVQEKTNGLGSITIV